MVQARLPVRGRVADGVAQHKPLTAVVDRSTEEHVEGAGVRAGGVLGDKAEGDTGVGAQISGAGHEADQLGDVPALDQAADRRRTEEAVDLDRFTGRVSDVDHGGDVVGVGPSGAAHLQAQLLVAVLFDQALAVGDRGGASAGQTDVSDLDPARCDQMQDLDLLVDARVAHGRRLDAVAQGLVDQLETGLDHRGSPADLVPVVDDVVSQCLAYHRCLPCRGAGCQPGPRRARRPLVLAAASAGGVCRQPGRLFRANPGACSGPTRAPVPGQPRRQLQANPGACSGPTRAPAPGQPRRQS